MHAERASMLGNDSCLESAPRIHRSAYSFEIQHCARFVSFGYLCIAFRHSSMFNLAMRPGDVEDGDEIGSSCNKITRATLVRAFFSSLLTHG